MDIRNVDELFDKMGEWRPNQVKEAIMLKMYQPGDATNYQVFFTDHYKAGREPTVYVAIGAGDYVQAGWEVSVAMLAELFRKVQLDQLHPADLHSQPIVDYLRGKVRYEMNRWTIFVALTVAAIFMFGNWEAQQRLPGLINMRNDAAAYDIINSWELIPWIR